MVKYSIYEGLEGEKYYQIAAKKSDFTIFSLSPYTNQEVEKIFTVVGIDNDEICGLGIATIYREGTIKRCNQWIFGENRRRNFWIEHLWIDKNSSCRGKEILKICEEKLIENQDLADRKNIYTLSIEDSAGFYFNQGYQEINTLPTDEDEDEISSFCDNRMYWYAKPIFDVLDNETIFKFDEKYLLTEAITRKREDLIAPITKVRIITHFNDFDFFNHPEKSDLPFFQDLVKFKKNFDVSIMTKYFNLSEEQLEELFEFLY